MNRNQFRLQPVRGLCWNTEGRNVGFVWCQSHKEVAPQPIQSIIEFPSDSSRPNQLNLALDRLSIRTDPCSTLKSFIRATIVNSVYGDPIVGIVASGKLEKSLA